MQTLSPILIAMIGTILYSGFITVSNKELLDANLSGDNSLMIASHPECIPFIGNSMDERNTSEFQLKLGSPGAPHRYKPRLDCIRLLVAPPNHRVLLTLSEDFELEESSGCRFDALDVRDGPFGWSPAVGERLCGTRGRGLRVLSSGRVLWLRFVSDVSLEARGFQGIVRFINDSEVKLLLASDSSIIHRNFNISDSHYGGPSADINGSLLWERVWDIITVDINFRIMLVLVYSASNSTSSKAASDIIPVEKPSQAESCLEMYETSSAHLRGPRLCGTVGVERIPTVALRTSGPRLIIRAVAPTGQHAPSFTARYTILKTGACTSRGEFDCGEDSLGVTGMKVCVNLSAVCDGHCDCDFRCENKLDEAHCGRESYVDPTAVGSTVNRAADRAFHLLIVAIACAAIVGFASLCGCVAWKGNKKRHVPATPNAQRNAVGYVSQNSLSSRRASGSLRSPVKATGRPTTLPLAGSTRRSNGLSHSADPTPVRRRAQHLTRSAAHEPQAYQPERISGKRSLSSESLQRRHRYGLHDGAQAARIGRYLSGSSELLAVDSRSLEELRQALGSPLHQTLVPRAHMPEAGVSGNSNYAGEGAQECSCPSGGGSMSNLPSFGRQQSAPAEMPSLLPSAPHTSSRAERAILVNTNALEEQTARVQMGVGAPTSEEQDERLCIVVGETVAWAPRATAINGTITLL